MKTLFTATAFERRATFSIASIMAIRMLGLLMILPVFSLGSAHLQGATSETIGIALGIYGLTQACLQIPFGMLSDRIGRKPVITMGLCIFAAGSLLAASAHTITLMIIARAIQGAGAVGSSCIALLADCTREEQRTKSMATLGMSIGVAFAVAMVLGPLLNHGYGLSGLFMVVFVLAILALLLLWSWVPTPKHTHFHADAEPELNRLGPLLRHPQLLRLDYGILCLHACLTALFTRLPSMLSHGLHVPGNHQWTVYLPIMFLSFIAMLPMVIVAESKHRMKSMFITAIVCLLTGVACLIAASFKPYTMIMVGLWLFFTGFNALEAVLPSLISKVAPLGRKGTAVGIFSTAQFFGIFLGGAGAGFFQTHWGANGSWWLMLLLLIPWLLLAITMPKPPTWAHHMVNLLDDPAAKQQHIVDVLKKTPGVLAVRLNPKDGIAYLKIDTKMVSRSTLQAIVASEQSR